MRRRRGVYRTHAIRKHAKKRAFQRYHTLVNRDVLDTIARCVQAQKGIFLRRRSYHVSEWLVRFNGSTLRILYDCKRHMVLTFLPLPAKYPL